MLTFVVACLVSLGQWLRPYFGGSGDLLFLTAIGICFAAIGIAAPWAVLGAGRPLMRSAVVLGIAAASGIVPNLMRREIAWFWISMFVLEAAFLLASLAVVRWCGFRLECASEGRRHDTTTTPPARCRHAIAFSECRARRPAHADE